MAVIVGQGAALLRTSSCVVDECALRSERGNEDAKYDKFRGITHLHMKFQEPASHNNVPQRSSHPQIIGRVVTERS